MYKRQIKKIQVNGRLLKEQFRWSDRVITEEEA